MSTFIWVIKYCNSSNLQIVVRNVFQSPILNLSCRTYYYEDCPNVSLVYVWWYYIPIDFSILWYSDLHLSCVWCRYAYLHMYNAKVILYAIFEFVTNFKIWKFVDYFSTRLLKPCQPSDNSWHIFLRFVIVSMNVFCQKDKVWLSLHLMSLLPEIKTMTLPDAEK